MIKLSLLPLLLLNFLHWLFLEITFLNNFTIAFVIRRLHDTNSRYLFFILVEVDQKLPKIIQV